MSEKELGLLRIKVLQLEDMLVEKEKEVLFYKKELQKFSENLDMILNASSQDVELLNKLHKTLVPTETSEIPGFEMSRKFYYGTKSGGDYFDIFPHKDKFKFGIILASSSSYGASATLLSVILENTDLLDGKKDKTVEETVKTLGDQLLKRFTDKEETQLFYATIDRRRLQMTFSCIGDLSGVLAIPGESIKIISSDSKGIALNRPIEYSSLTVDLKPRSRICLLSQGVTQVLSQDEIVQVVEQTASGSVHELRNQILVQAQIKSGVEQPMKDQTVIVIEAKDNIIKLARDT